MMSSTDKNNNSPKGKKLLIIREHLLNGKFKLETSQKKGTGSSSVWNTFLDVIDDENKKTAFVCCTMCKKVYIFLPNNGTTKLLVHQRKCLQSSNNSNHSEGDLLTTNL